jgi:tellurite resistance-related uncharacterized protein
VPAGLRHRHQTEPGVWGLIVVLEGRLRFRRLEPLMESELGPAHLGIVAPEEPHEVEPLGPVKFFVEFHAAPMQHAVHRKSDGIPPA